MSEITIAKNLSYDISQVVERYGMDTDKCVQMFFKIKDKLGNIVKFRFNRPQRLHAERSTRFDNVLKARKLGISSRRIASDIWKCATRKREHRVLLTHTGEGADIMMAERVKPMLENCLYPLGAKTRADYIYFTLTDSRYYVGTAGARKFGRGDDITGKHYSEKAHWKNPDVARGVDEALVDNADGLTETTANGHNFYKNEWEIAKRGKGLDKAIFLPWYTDESYIRDPQLEPGTISEEELSIMEAFNLTADNIAWRRWKKRTMSDPALFPQEYPETDEEAFLSSGRPVFDKLSLARLRQLVCEPKQRGYIVQQLDRIVFIPNAEGPLRIWKMPERGHVYAIGADIAEGIKDGAYSTGEIIDVGDSEQVAEWHGHIAPDIFSDTLYLLSRFYNQAVIIPESYPGPGEVTSSHLVELNAKLWTQPGKERVGFETNRQTKPAMIASFNSAIRDFALTIRSPELLEEMHSFIYDDKMSMGPSVGNYSDRVMGMGIAYHCTRDLAERTDYYRPQKPEFIKKIAVSSITTSPKWSGPMQGRRE